MGRHVYNNKDYDFVKVTVEIERELYDKLISLKNDFGNKRSIKEIFNEALREYLEL